MSCAGVKLLSRGSAILAVWLGVALGAAGMQDSRPAPPAPVQTGQLPVCERQPLPWRIVDGRPSPQDLEALRRRFETFDPEQQAELAERFRRFLAMDEAARRELRERASNIERLEEHLCRRLSPAERARLDRLAPAQRAQVLREMFRGELESQGQRLALHLPEELRERLANATAEDRLRYFQQFKAHVHERMSANAIRSLGNELGLPREEVQALLELPGPGRVEAALELGKRLGRRQVERSGLPPGLTLERWREIEALPPEEFHQAFLRLSDGLRRPPASDAAPQPSLEQQLRDALRPRRDQILEHADLPREERQRAIRLEQRPIVTDVLRRSGLLDEAQMAELEALPDSPFYAQVRRLARERDARPGEHPRPRLPGQPGEAEPRERRGPPGGAWRGGRQGKPRDL